MTSESVPEPPVPDLDLRWPARTVGDGLPLTRLILIEPDAGELPFQGQAGLSRDPGHREGAERHGDIVAPGLGRPHALPTCWSASGSWSRSPG